MYIAHVPINNLDQNVIKIYQNVLASTNYTLKLENQRLDSAKFSLNENDIIIPNTEITEQNYAKIIHKYIPSDFSYLHDKAYNISKKIHKPKKRDAGLNVFENHILPVTTYYVLTCKLLKKAIDIELIICSLLHDVIEDSNDEVVVFTKDVKPETKLILEEIFNKNICLIISILTKPKILPKYERDKLYFNNINMNNNAALIKCVDRILNIASDIDIAKNQYNKKPLVYIDKTIKSALPTFSMVEPYYRKMLDIVIMAVNETYS